MRLDEDLLSEAKQLAAKTGKTLTAIIEDALRARLAASRKGLHRSRIKLPTFKGQGVLPGVDLDDSAALLGLMEQHRDPS